MSDDVPALLHRTAGDSRQLAVQVHDLAGEEACFATMAIDFAGNIGISLPTCVTPSADVAPSCAGAALRQPILSLIAVLAAVVRSRRRRRK